MTLGRIVYELIPGEGNPRNSEGAFITLGDGRILYIYSRYRGNSYMDHARADIAAIESRDGGESWGRHRILLDSDREGAQNLMSVSLMTMANGDLGLFYLHRRGWRDLGLRLIRSSDGGESFGPPVEVMDLPRYHVVNNDRVVRLSTGRILVPAAVHGSELRTNAAGEREEFFDSRAVAWYFASDDDGASFRPLPGRAMLGFTANTVSGLQEPGVVELKSGVLWSWARTDLGRQYEMFSLDGGESWTASQPSRFTGPCSPMSVKRLPDGRLLALWNPVPAPNGAKSPPPGAYWNGGRTPLVAALSADEGRSWSDPIPVEDDPVRGYCYVAIHMMEDSLLLAYCAGHPQDGGCLNRTVLRKVEYAAFGR